MKKKWILSLALIVMLGLTACSGNGKTENNGAPADKGGEVVINLPTAATTGALYPLGASLATLWNEEVDGVRVSSQASNGGIDNLNLVQSGEAQVSLGVTSIIHHSFNGTDTFEGRPNDTLRVIAGLYYNPNQVVVRGDSGITSLEELTSKNFAAGAPGSTTEVETNLHLTAVGLTYPDDIQAQYIGFTEATDLMRNKQLDGAWIMAGIPTAAVTEMTSTADGRLIPIEKEVVEKLKLDYPWYASMTIPAGTYAGQEEDVPTSAIKMALYTTENMPEDVVYELTKAFWDNLEVLQASNNSLKGITVEDAVTDLADLPLHSGAERYYKEIGVL